VGGTEGNARLTAATAAVLLLLLAAEGATIPFIRPLLTMHVLLGLALIPPALLKLGSTGWRFVRYYRRDPAYVEKGPPHPFMRLLVAPLVVASTVVLLATGVALAMRHPQGGLVLGLHKASFVVWFGAMSVHVLAHLPAMIRRHALISGRMLRGALVAGTLVAGAAIAVAALPAAHAWAHWAVSH
jgi:hypothetical protein